MPDLDDVSPRVGPKAGGTMVTITGVHLNIGSSLKVTLDNKDCYVET